MTACDGGDPLIRRQYQSLGSGPSSQTHTLLRGTHASLLCSVLEGHNDSLIGMFSKDCMAFHQAMKSDWALEVQQTIILFGIRGCNFLFN